MSLYQSWGIFCNAVLISSRPAVRKAAKTSSKGVISEGFV